MLSMIKRVLKAIPGFKRLYLYCIWRQFCNPNHLSKHLFYGVYDTYHQAEQALPATRPSGYDNDDPANMYLDRLGRVCPNDYPMLYWLKDFVQEIDSIVDFGGHIGIGYYAYANALDLKHIHWTNYDVPAVVNKGREIAELQQVTNLEFTDDFKSIQHTDLFMASGSLQYLKTDIWQMIEDMPSQPNHILISMLPIYDGDEFYTVQNIGTAFCPYRIYNKTEFLNAFKAMGYELIDYWQHPEKNCFIPLDPVHSQDAYYGMYLRKAKHA